MRPHLFEFMDHPRIPSVIRTCLLETLEYCNQDFRPYYREVARRVLSEVEKAGITQIVEAGAGSAPITQALITESNDTHVRFRPCDLYPPSDGWHTLSDKDKRVQPIGDPVDLLNPPHWDDQTTVVLCATLHHIPFELRLDLLRRLLSSCGCVMVFEPICCSRLSVGLAILAWGPAMLMPLFRLHRKGRLRRFFLCSPVPVVPMMFTWDAVVSCLRQWTTEEWEAAQNKLEQEGVASTLEINPHSTVYIARRNASPESGEVHFR